MNHILRQWLCPKCGAVIMSTAVPEKPPMCGIRNALDRGRPYKQANPPGEHAAVTMEAGR